jgi:DNA-binding NarL/FixJ family response regulator
MTVRVVIADDHPLFREGLRALIVDSPQTDLSAPPPAETKQSGWPSRSDPTWS